jgi:hypothetical protein
MRMIARQGTKNFLQGDHGEHGVYFFKNLHELHVLPVKKFLRAFVPLRLCVNEAAAFLPEGRGISPEGAAASQPRATP